MDKEKFKSLWKLKFSDAYPIGYTLKWIYEDKWFRIHSLPKSKRYAETEDEYQIIYQRQNEIIDDLIGDHEDVVLLFGLYRDGATNDNYREITEFSTFEKVDILKLHEIDPEQNEEECYFDIYIRETTWESNKRNEILRAIADDEIRMMIISFNKTRIVHPYDGGVDLILESGKVRNKYKKKYKEWLSSHPKGL